MINPVYAANAEYYQTFSEDEIKDIKVNFKEYTQKTREANRKFEFN